MKNQPTKSFKGSSIQGYVISSEYPNNPYSQKHLKERIQDHKRQQQKLQAVPISKVKQQTDETLVEKPLQPKSTERLPIASQVKRSTQNLEKSPLQQLKQQSPSRQPISNVNQRTADPSFTAFQQYNSFKIPVNIAHQEKNSDTSNRSVQQKQRMALNVTGSTICKPISFRKGDKGEYQDHYSNADIKAVKPHITENTTSNVDSKDIQKESQFSDAKAETSLDNETMHQATERDKQIETERDQQVIDQITTALISARNAGARELADILDESINGDTKSKFREETQISQERRTIRVTGNENFSTQGDPVSTVSKSPTDENHLSLALVPVDEKSEQQIQEVPKESQGSQYDKSTLYGPLNTEASIQPQQNIQLYAANNTDLNSIMPFQIITSKRSLSKYDTGRSATSFSAKVQSSQKAKYGSSLAGRRSVMDIKEKTLNDRQLSLNALELYKKQRKRWLSGSMACDEEKIAGANEQMEKRVRMVERLLGNSHEAQKIKSQFSKMISVPQEKFDLKNFKKLNQDLKTQLKEPHKIYKEQMMRNPKHIMKLTQVEDLIRVLPVSAEDYETMQMRFSGFNTLQEDSINFMSETPSVKTLALENKPSLLSAAIDFEPSQMLESGKQTRFRDKPKEEDEANPEHAGIFITNEEFVDQTPLQPIFQGHKKSTPLPQLNSKARLIEKEKQRLGKKISHDFGKRDLMFSESAGTIAKINLHSGQSEGQLIAIHPQTMHVQSQQFECDNYEDVGSQRLLSNNQLRFADKANHSVALINRTTNAQSQSMLTEEETQSLGRYQIRVDFNRSPTRSKTSLFRKSNMSQILGRESRMLKKLKQRVEMQYKLTRKFRQSGWQDESGAKGFDLKPNYQTRSTMRMSEVNGDEAADAHNIVINNGATVGHHTFNMTTEENIAEGRVTISPTIDEKQSTKANQDKRTEVPILLEEEDNQQEGAATDSSGNYSSEHDNYSNGLAPWQEPTDPSMAFNSQVPTMQTPIKKNRKSKTKSKARDKQKIWCEDTTNNYTKNMQFLNEHKKKRELVNNAQIAKILRYDLSTLNDKKESSPVAQKKRKNKLRKRSKTRPFNSSEVELQKTFKLMIENQSDKSGESLSGHKIGYKVETMNITHEDGINQVQKIPETSHHMMIENGSEAEPILVQNDDKSPTGDDAITLNTSKFSSRMLIPQKSTFTINEGHGEQAMIQQVANPTQETNRMSKNQTGYQSKQSTPGRAGNTVLQSQSMPRIDVRSIPLNEPVHSRGQNLSSAETLGKDLAHLGESKVGAKSTVKSPSPRSKSKSSATLEAQNTNHRNVVALDQYTSINSSQHSQLTRSEYLHNEMFNLYKALNSKSQKSKVDLSKVRIRGKNILNQQQVADINAYRSTGHNQNSSAQKESQANDSMIEPPKTDGAAKHSSNQDQSLSQDQLDRRDPSKTVGNSTTRSKGATEAKEKRVYLRVPITEVIIKTSVLPEKNRSRSPEKQVGVGSGQSTVQLITQKPSTVESDEPMILEEQPMDPYRQPREHRELSMQQMRITGDTYVTAEGPNHSHSEHLATHTSDAAKVSNHLIGFNPPQVSEHVANRLPSIPKQTLKKQEKKEPKKAKPPLLLEPKIISQSTFQEKPQQVRKSQEFRHSLTIRNNSIHADPLPGEKTEVRFATNETLMELKRVIEPSGVEADDNPIYRDKETQGTIEDDMPVILTQTYNKVNIARKRSLKQIRPKKQVHVLSQVNLGANLEQEPTRKPSQLAVAIQTPMNQSADLQHLAEAGAKPPTIRHLPAEQDRFFQFKLKKSAKKSKKHDRHNSSQDNIKYDIKNGVLRQSVQSNDSRKSHLPAIRVNKLSVGPSSNEFVRGETSQAHLVTGLQTEQLTNIDTTGRQILPVQTPAEQNPYQNARMELGTLINERSLQFFGQYNADGQSNSEIGLNSSNHGSMGARSNSQSQITPLQSKLRPTDSPEVQLQQQQVMGQDEPFILHTNLDQETVATILQSDPNAFVTIVIPPDTMETEEKKEQEHP